MTKTLQIGSLVVSTLEALDLDQTYERIGGESIFRAADGTGIKQASWDKLRVTTSGGGWMPPALSALDVNQTQVLRCVVPRAVPCAGLVATLPAARRSDAGHVPYGIAYLASGEAVKTPASLAGDVATLAAVSGATSYVALYYPELTVWLLRPRTSGNPRDATHRWELVCEEV